MAEREPRRIASRDGTPGESVTREMKGSLHSNEQRQTSRHTLGSGQTGRRRVVRGARALANPVCLHLPFVDLDAETGTVRDRHSSTVDGEWLR